MMLEFAEDMSAKLSDETVVDVGLTDKPYYNDKSAAIDESEAYPSAPLHIHLTGYDTFIRIFNPKYYSGHSPPLSALNGFFAKHGLFVMLRPDGESDERKQREYLEDIRQGKLEKDGAKKEWAHRIRLAPSSEEAVDVSSTKVREAMTSGDEHTLRKFCTPRVADWVSSNGLYKSGESKMA